MFRQISRSSRLLVVAAAVTVSAAATTSRPQLAVTYADASQPTSTKPVTSTRTWVEWMSGSPQSTVQVAPPTSTATPSVEPVSVAVTAAPKVKVDYAAVRRDVLAIIDADADMGPTLVRLAWHASGTYDKATNTGGSNGSTMRFSQEASWGANAGLAKARQVLEPIKQKYPGLSYADLWTLAGASVIEAMGGPQIRWRAGRSDDKDGSRTVEDGRLPAADKGSDHKTAQHLRSEVFHRMGFTDRDIVALSGAHCLGRCHTDASGYWGPWSYSPTTFSNEYFRLLFAVNWRPKTTHEGKPWTGPHQYESEDGQLMMLPADLVVASDPVFRPIAEQYAKDEQVFFNDFAAAFAKLLELGCNNLKDVEM